MLACIAPRPLYAASGADDLWADPVGEYLSAHHASEVYRLLGKKGLDSPNPPAVGVALTQGGIAYHNRPGGHSVDLYDWQQFLGFAERHFRQ